MIEQTIFKYEDLEFVVDYEFDKGGKETDTDFGWAPYVEVHAVWLSGVDMYDMLQKNILEYIEMQLLSEHID